MNYYKKWILPRVYFFPYYIHLLILSVYSLFIKKCERSSKLIISAGIKGWDSIEFKELLQSAIEYFNDIDKVIQHKVTNDYYSELKGILKNQNITHALYDPRSGSQGLILGFIEAVKISFLFCRYNVIPIILLTDISHRKMRIKGAIVSAKFGIAVSFVSTKIMHPLMPHNRIYGPLVMPFSTQSLNEIDKIRKKTTNNNFAASFIGSLYEPRTTILNEIKIELLKCNINFEIKGRGPSGERRPDSEYWETIKNASIVITTSDQIISKDLDWAWTPSLVYRYLEALSCGTLLLAPRVPAVDRYFEAGIDFISFETPEEAVNKIIYFNKNIDKANEIANSGYEKAKSLIHSKIFWLQIDFCLGKNSIF